MDYNLNKIISAQSKYLIKNNYEVIKNNKRDEFHVVIYYINENKVEAVVRKLNNEGGWNYDLKIKIDQEMLSIGSCNNNFKILELYTNSKISYNTYKILNYIPKIIIQTNKEMVKNLIHYNTIMSIIEKNPNYDYIFFNDIDARNFIKENFTVDLLNFDRAENEICDVLRAYDLLKCGALRADFFRYCYLYVNGGIYLDSKISSLIDFDKIIHENDKFVICSDDAPESYYNGIIMTEKQNFRLLQVIKQMVENIFNQDYLNDIHEPTGNKLFYKYFKNEEVKLIKKRNLVFFGNQLAFKCDYPNYYSQNYHDFRKNYVDRDYYYYYNFYTSNYVFKFSKDITHHIFSVFHLKDNIYCIKNNSNKGWNEKFVLHIFDTLTSETKIMTIDKSRESEYVITI